MLILIKIILSVSIVLVLVYISEKSPKFGGLLAGLPLSVGIFVYFYAKQEGIPFLIHSIPYSIAGLSSNLIFTMGFYLGGKLFKNKRVLNTLSAFSIGAIVFLVSGYFITLFHFTLLTSLIFFLITMTISILFFIRTTTAINNLSAKNTSIAIAFRAFFATVLILTITSLTNLVGPKWAGVLAASPVMLGSVVIILIFTYRDEIYPKILKHFSYSVSILALYFLLALWLYPTIGIAFGTVIAYIVCFVYLYLLSLFGKTKAAKL